MCALAETFCSPEEYLALERAAEVKSELVNGKVYAMSGASREHNLIAGNVFGELRSQLRGKPCEAYVADMRVKVSPTGMYTYPDVVVVCGEPEFEDVHGDTLVNPVLIVEVLSPSTEAYDRGEKFAHYRRLPSLVEYVLVSQDKPRVERFVRREHGNEWVLTEISGLDGILGVLSVGAEVALKDIYEKVPLPSGESA